MDALETRYARSGDVNIAYQVAGGGGVDLVWIPGFAQHVELNWEEPYRHAWLSALSQRFRLITFDKRGTGLSDGITGEPPLEVRMDDIRAVLDAAGSRRAVIVAAGDAGALAAVFAAAHPDRVRALALWAFAGRETWAPDHPWGPPRQELLRWIDDLERRWPQSLEDEIASMTPGLTREEQRGFARVIRYSVSPGAAAAFRRIVADIDVRHVLPTVRVPVLVLYPARHPRIEAGRAAADAMPFARFVALDVPQLVPPAGDPAPLVDAIAGFVDETPADALEQESVLATVLFTDIVGSTARAAELGDRVWRDLLQRHHALTRRELARFRGTEHDTAGDGFFASFDGPARAIRCACAIRQSVRELGIEIRAGVHTGECELLDRKVAGIAVSIGARVAAQADAGECSSRRRSKTSSRAPASRSTIAASRG